MVSAAEQLFDNLNTYKDLEQLIEDGTTEDQFLEAKAPTSPTLTKAQKVELAKAVSGYSNSGGGIIIWGISTTKHNHGNLDVLSQIEPIGNCKSFSNQISKFIPLSTNPSVRLASQKIIKRRPSDSQGIIVTYIPEIEGNPLRSNTDQRFYLRLGDEWGDMPYDLLMRMFTGGKSPQLVPIIRNELCVQQENGIWNIPFVVHNLSTNVAEKVSYLIEVLNPNNCIKITSSQGITDLSSVNPGKTIFSYNYSEVIHKGFGLNIGKINFTMRKQCKVLNIKINLFANQMRARSWYYKFKLLKAGIEFDLVKEEYLY